MFINKYVYLLTYSSYLICSPGKPEGNIPFKPLIHKNNRKAQELYGRLTQTFYDQKKTLLYIYAFFCTFLLVILFIYISNVIPLSSFPSTNPHPLPTPPASMKVLPQPPTPASMPQHSPTLGHRASTGPRGSPPIDVR